MLRFFKLVLTYEKPKIKHVALVILNKKGLCLTNCSPYNINNNKRMTHAKTGNLP